MFGLYQQSEGQRQYEHLLSILIQTMVKRIIKFYKQEDCNEDGFSALINRIIVGMKVVEQQIQQSLRYHSIQRTAISDVVRPLQMFVNDRHKLQQGNKTTEVKQVYEYNLNLTQTSYKTNDAQPPKLDLLQVQKQIIPKIGVLSVKRPKRTHFSIEQPRNQRISTSYSKERQRYV